MNTYSIRFPRKPQGGYRWAKRARCAVVRSDHPHKVLTAHQRGKTWWLICNEVDLRSRKQVAFVTKEAEAFIANLS